MADDQQFGGAWTQQKLEALARYLRAYTTALKHQPFKLAYIDAFAGTGYRAVGAIPNDNPALFDEACAYLAGSVRIALETEPDFDLYIFIDRVVDHIRQLEALCRQFPQRHTRLIGGEANDEIRRFCFTTHWQEWRAVLFLDPYGMQVEWPTLEAIAQTRAVDLWLLVPIGIAINRILPNSGEIPLSWQRRLDVFFGTTAWREAAYTSYPDSESVQTRLFREDDIADNVQRASLERIEQFFIQRLRTIFPAVLEPPLKLYNSRGTWLYSLFFAIANEKSRSQKIALRIARHIVSQARGA